MEIRNYILHFPSIIYGIIAFMFITTKRMLSLSFYLSIVIIIIIVVVVIDGGCVTYTPFN